MGNGGTQRNMVNILNNINLGDKKKFLLIYNATKTSDLENQIDSSIKVYRVTSTSFLKHFLRLKMLLYIVINKNITSIISFAINGTILSLISKLILPFRKILITYRLVSVDSALTYSKYKLISKLKSFFYINFLCRFVNTIICQTDFMLRSLVTQSPKKLKTKTIVIRNLIDTKLIQQKLNDVFNVNYKYFIFVGRLSKEKNIIQIIHAFNIIKRKVDHKLLIIGDGDEFDNISFVIKSLHLQSRVLMLGFQANPYKYLVKSDALILFSQYEGLPNVVLESMYCKTPVVVSDFKGVDEIVCDNETGFIVNNFDIDMLAQILIKIVLKDNSEMVINAYKHVNNLNEESLIKYRNLIS